MGLTEKIRGWEAPAGSNPIKPQPATTASIQKGGASTVADGHHTPRRQIRSDELFDGRRAVLIEHSGELYTLRQTSKGKLILTK